MDTTDPDITFDEYGVCSHCRHFEAVTRHQWFPNAEGARRWEQIVDQVKREGKNKEYDCIIGLSGGLDSAYLAYKIRDAGLRPLAVHVDGGWNSEIAVANIERMVKALRLDLYTHVVDWEEMRDLQLAFFRASVANQDVPQDHAFFAELYRCVLANDIKYFLIGGNIATECVLPESWGYNAMDLRHIMGIHRKFGKTRLEKFPKIGFMKLYGMQVFGRLKVVRPLNLMEYDREKAAKDLLGAVGWRHYGAKHHESRFTKFFQSYYLPVKFGFDKRKAHLSSLIVTGQMNRSDAMEELTRPPFDGREISFDMAFVAKKLGVDLESFKAILELPCRTYRDYPSNASLFVLKNSLVSWMRR
jgi:N-acetyl sugar amidotransferase